ncbi:MAG: hypothetical protein ACRDBO_03965 [Lachnospiraceae bacterium]
MNLLTFIGYLIYILKQQHDEIVLLVESHGQLVRFMNDIKVEYSKEMI